jgi:phosphohistidine phosphatase
MEIIIVRHADAGSRDPKKYPDDSARPLSIDGKAEMLKVARGMRRLDIAFDEIIDSGYVRARQTSECICDAYEIDREAIRTMAELAPETEPVKTLAALRKLRGLKRVALVGHEPHLSAFAGFLLAAETAVAMDLKKAGVCRLELPRWSPGAATLLAFYPPKVLRKLGK